MAAHEHLLWPSAPERKRTHPLPTKAPARNPGESPPPGSRPAVELPVDRAVQQPNTLDEEHPPAAVDVHST